MAYALAHSYVAESLLSGFNWFDTTDPSNGFVDYQNRENAEKLGLVKVDEFTNATRLGVDYTNTYTTEDEGRPSIRLESKETYDHGLFIADFEHMPPSQCGLWPAFWAYGTDWPTGGELDIIEGANTAHSNIISAHTETGCSQDSSQDGLYEGKQRNKDCGIGEDNIGCGYDMPSDDHTSYGDSFNAVKGGVYAMKWDSDHISVWHFSRGKVPSDISDKNPDPSSWGLPDAIFGGDSCNVDKYFKNMSLVININFCGDYGSAAWGTEDSCNNFADSCPKYVAENPEAFANAYWDVNYIDAYQWSDKATPTKKHSSTSSASTASSTSTPASSASSSAAAVPTSSPAITTPAPGATTPAPAGFDTTVTQGVTVTTTTSCPTPTATNPVTANKFSHLGCFSSSSSFGCFNSTASNDAMTVELCTSQCAGHTFAAVSGSKCFCADSLDAGTRAATFDASEPSAQCDQPCPGNGDELCGSQSSHLMNVYGAVQDEVRSMDPPPMATTVPKWYNSPDGDAEDLPSTTAAAATTLATAAAGKNGTAIITSPPTTNTYVPIARAAEHAAPSLLVVFSTVLVLGFLAL